MESHKNPALEKLFSSFLGLPQLLDHQKMLLQPKGLKCKWQKSMKVLASNCKILADRQAGIDNRFLRYLSHGTSRDFSMRHSIGIFVLFKILDSQYNT